MPVEQYTYWSMTINNPEENDYVLVRNPNSKYIRELVWTMEVGDEGTEHIQAWIRLQRNQGLTFVKRLYPRAHLKNCDKDQYNENCHDYAQKNDETTAGNHHITLNDPIPSIERLIIEVISRTVDSLSEGSPYNGRYGYCLKAVSYRTIHSEASFVERDLVREKGPMYAKVFVSPVYARLWKQYGEELFTFWRNGKLAEIDETISQTVNIPTTDAGDEVHTEGGQEGPEGDRDSDEEGCSQTDEGHEQSASDQSDEEDASSEC